MQVPDTPNIDPISLADMVSRAKPGPNFIQKSVLVISSLNLQAWEKYYDIYAPSDPSLLDQLRYGFPTGVEDPSKLSVPFTNHASSRSHPHIVEEYINKHIQSGAIFGPFQANPLNEPIVVSPLQVAFSSTGKARVCNDLSYGHCSVNSLISSAWDEYPGYTGDLELPRIDALVRAVLERGPGCMIWKTDYSAYYKQLNSDPGDLPHLAFAFDNRVYFESRLPFGLRSSCLNAQRVTNAVILIFETKSRAFLAGYIDDCVGCSIVAMATYDYTTFRQLNRELGLTTTDPKCVAPCFALVWIGLECDTQDMKLRIPEDKRSRLIQFLQQWLEKVRASKTELQAILGVLNHAAAAIIVGRAFTSHITDLLSESEFPITLPTAFYEDVQLWMHFLQSEIANSFSLKSPIYIPVDHLVQVAIDADLFAVRVLDHTQIFQVIDTDIDIDHACLYVLAFWKVSELAAPKFPGTWLTCGVMTEVSVKTINRARKVCDALRHVVRYTWALQAKWDMVIRAKKVICERDIDRVIRSASTGTPVSYKHVPKFDFAS